ncbi:MAG: phosphate/phosphite/phosphonate ABC transporter substrate-binding protein [Anaerolineae bacterium]|nr:phosphate/phosphite/phosphonate ABC transporter substrate-binding protein [Anaerolineae bacterium]
MTRKLFVILSLAVILTLALSACGPKEPELGTEENPIIWSFVPSQESETVLAGAQQIADLVEEKTGIVIQANIATEYAGVIEAMCNGEAQMGALNTFSYVLASERECAAVALASVRYGTTFYTGQIVAGADTGISSVADLAGKTFCRPDPLSTSGWIIPSITMQAQGIDPETDLKQVVDAGGHDGVITAVYNGDCEAGSSFVDARSNVEEELPDVKDKVLVIETSPPIPNDTISFAKDVPDELRDKIVAALLEIASDEAYADILNDTYSWSGLEAVDDSFYDPFRQTLDAAGVDIEGFMN